MPKAKHSKKCSETSQSLSSRVLEVIRQQGRPAVSERVLLGVSGGADSLALLHLLAQPELALDLHVLYLDHGLRPQQTPYEEQLVAEASARLNCTFSSRKIAVTERLQATGESMEEAARKLRHRALEEERQRLHADWIALGHTADDQVEEYFLRLFRGTGLTGISGMRYCRGRVIRPLLQETKEALRGYLRKLGQPWAEDASNQDQSYLRNRIRHSLLPEIEGNYQPALRQVMLRHMAVLREEDELLQQQAQDVLANLAKPCTFPASATLSCQAMSKSARALVRRAVDLALGQLEIPVSTALLNRLIDLASEGANGDELHLPGNWRVERSAAELRFIKLEGALGRKALPQSAEIYLDIPCPGVYEICAIAKQLTLTCRLRAETKDLSGDMLVLDRDKVSFPLRLRSLRPGDRFHPFGRQGSKKVAHYLREKNIPARYRPSWPVLLQGDAVIALPGMELAEAVKTDEKTKNILVISFVDHN